jgi:hypothetical protein
VIACLWKSGRSPSLLNALKRLVSYLIKAAAKPGIAVKPYHCVPPCTLPPFSLPTQEESGRVSQPGGAGRRHAPGNLS